MAQVSPDDHCLIATIMMHINYISQVWHGDAFMFAFVAFIQHRLARLGAASHGLSSPSRVYGGIPLFKRNSAVRATIKSSRFPGHIQQINSRSPIVHSNLWYLPMLQ